MKRLILILALIPALLFGGRTTNGTTQHFDAATTFVTNFPFTVIVWFKLTTLPATTTYIWSISSTGVDQRWVGLFVDGANGLGGGSKTLYVVKNNGVQRNATAGGNVLAVDTWYCVVCDFFSATSMTVYFNGASGTETASEAFPSAANVTTVGGYRFSGGFLLGQDLTIGQFSIIGTQLTAGEITSALAGIGAKRIRPQNTVGDVWDFIGSGTDSNGLRGNVLTNTGSCPQVADYPRLYLQ